MGIQHRPDTLERIRERTRMAMYRSDVRQRWAAGWEPKAHSKRTKDKLRSVMLKKEKEKLEYMLNWVIEDLGIVTFGDFSSRLQVLYRRNFKNKWRMNHFMNNNSK